MGGSDEPWNLMELSRRDHGIAHVILYKLYGHKEDLWAANVLLGGEDIDQSGDNNPMADPDVKKKHLENHPFRGKFGPEASNYKDGRCADPKKYHREYMQEYSKTDKEKEYRRDRHRKWRENATEEELVAHRKSRNEYMKEYRKRNKNATV